MSFKEFLRKRLKELDMSYQEFSVKLTINGYPVTKSGVANWLDSTKDKNPKITNTIYRKALAQTLRITENELIELFGMDVKENNHTSEAIYALELIDPLPENERKKAIRILEEFVKG